MIKKIILILITLLILPTLTFASSSTAARIGNNYYDNLNDAIKNAKEEDTIILMSNIILDKGIIIDKIVNIDLNGNTISSPTAVFEIQKGFLDITGKGTIKELEPNYGVIRVIGSETPTDEKYSSVSVGKDVTLEGWAGIFVSHKNKKSYDAFVYVEGTINAVSDISGNQGIGIYVNGSIQDKQNQPTINILDGAKINSNGFGLYIAGYSNFYINKASITGEFAGIGIKSGNIEIDGATVTCTGKDTTPTEGYNNGINASGTTLQIESNSGYAGDIKLYIKDGNFISKNSNVVYEYIGKGSNTQVDTINISNGTFISESNKDIFLLSNSFKSKHTSFISGGKYTSNPDSYLLSGYSSNLENDYYVVSKSTMKTVFKETSTNVTNKILKLIITLVILSILSIIMYINRNKIIKIIKK